MDVPLTQISLQVLQRMAKRNEYYGPIDLQGLRKSGQMHKIRLTKNNYQLVAANAGQSPEVLMHHYNEALEVEKQQLASMLNQVFIQLLQNQMRSQHPLTQPKF